MKSKKIRIKSFSYYDHTGIEKHLEKMAKKGWMLHSVNRFFWTYRKIQPQNLHVCVTYYPRASEYDPGPSKHQQNFYDFCAHDGWQLACSRGPMQVFYNDRENPTPLETDPTMEVAYLHESCKHTLLTPSCILLGLLFVSLGALIYQLATDPIGFLSSISTLSSVLLYVFCSIYVATDLIVYLLWYGKAKKAAQDGIFMDTPNTRIFQLSFLLLPVAMLLYFALKIIFKSNYWGLIALLWVVLLVFGLIAATTGVTKLMKKGNASRQTNKMVTILVYTVLFFLVMGAVRALPSLYGDSGFHQDTEAQDVITLSITDLTDVQEDGYSAYLRSSESPFLRHDRIDESYVLDGGNNAMPDLFYTVTTVKTPFLYNVVLNQYLNGTSNQLMAVKGSHYTKIDPQPWGAEAAYLQSYSKYAYVLCYEQRIIFIRLDFTPTQDQIQRIVQALNP